MKKTVVKISLTTILWSLFLVLPSVVDNHPAGEALLISSAIVTVMFLTGRALNKICEQ